MDGGFFKLALLPLHLNKGKCGDEDGVVDGNEGFGLEAGLKDVRGFAFVVCEHALVEGCVGRDDGLIAEEDGEKSKRGDVAAHDDEADGERDGEDEADRTPDECPESGGDKDGEGGEAGVFAIDVGLDVVGGDDFKDDEEAEDERGVGPAGEDGEREQGGRERGDGCSDIGDEAADEGESCEEDGVGESDEIERCADDGSVDNVNGDLEKEVPGDATAGVAHGLSEQRQIAVTRQMNEAVAEVFALKEDEESEDDGEKRGGSGLDDTAELIETSRGAADFTDLQGMIRTGTERLGCGFAGGRNRSGGVSDTQFVADLLNLALRPAVGGVAGAVEGLHFLCDIPAVGGQIVGYGNQLGEQAPGSDAKEAGKDEDYGHRGDGARKTKALEHGDDGSEKKSEEDGESEGEQEDFAEIEDGDGEDRNRDEPELHEDACGGRGIH